MPKTTPTAEASTQNNSRRLDTPNRAALRKVDKAYREGTLELGKNGANGDGRPARGALAADGTRLKKSVYKYITEAIAEATTPAGKGMAKSEIVAVVEPRIKADDPTYTRTATRVATFFVDLKYRAPGGRDEAKGPRDGIGFGPDKDGEVTARVLKKGSKSVTREEANKKK